MVSGRALPSGATREGECDEAFDLFVCFEFYLVTGDGGDAHDHPGDGEVKECREQ